MTLTYRGQQYDQPTKVNTEPSNLQYRGVKYQKIILPLYASVRVPRKA